MSFLQIAAGLLLAAVVLAIFALARQGVEGTRRLAWRAEQLLMRMIPPTGTGEIGEPTWCGLTIRRLAHVVEYALLGLAASTCMLAWQGASWHTFAYVLGFCLLASLADETHKVFVPGRHFDAADLMLDAAGYLFAVLVTTGLAALVG